MDKNLKKLSRVELLELMISLSEDYEALADENNRLKKMLSVQRLPRSTKVGSIAEAALAANGYFESAQRSADSYLREIKHLRDELAQRVSAQGQAAGARVGMAQQPQMSFEVQQAQAQAGQIIARARSQADAIVADAQRRAEETLANANRQSHAILSQAQRQAAAPVPAPSSLQGLQIPQVAQPYSRSADATVEIPGLHARHTRTATDGGLR